MRMRGVLALVPLIIVTHAVAADTPPGRAPSIVIILADDLGFGDVSYQGGDVPTPNIDSIATDGVALDRFYTAPACTPTRAGLLTGRWPIRYGLMRSVIPPWRDYGLDPAEETLPEMLAEAGYERRACIGKWHLGHMRPQWLPLQQGFTTHIGNYNGGASYFTRERDGALDWYHDGKPHVQTGYTTDLIGDAAVNFIAATPDDDPYLLYVPFTASHGPLQAPEHLIALYEQTHEGDARTYAAMIHALDVNIGRILDAIAARDDADNTFVLFLSDNGAAREIGSNGPLRGHKLRVLEGGIRVPAAVRWPAGGLVGGRRSDVRMGYIDIVPTVRRIAGLHDPPERPLDGLDVLDAFRGDAQLPDRAWFTYLHQNPRRLHYAVHTDRWKLLVREPPIDEDGQRGPPAIELYRIDTDPGERLDWSTRHQDVVKELRRELRRFMRLRRDDQIPMYAERDDIEATEHATE
jgi:arylsulfatase B